MSKYINVKSHGDSVQPKDYKLNKIQQSPKITCIEEGMLAFDFNGIFIVDPTLDETGRYPVNPKSYYSLSAYDIRKIKNTNQKIKKQKYDYVNYKNGRI
jgi:hypothetical protein